MTVTSFAFLLFLLLGAAAYFITPGRFQWVTLLLLSLVFYVCAAAPYTFLWILISALTAYISTNLMVNPRIAARENGKKTVAVLAFGAVIVNVLLWFVLKGSSFWIHGSGWIHHLIPGVPVLKALPILGSMGMGYYTAQIIAYIVDCYWGNCVPYRNFFRVLLITCFFPQMMGGPISRHNQLEQIFESHHFSYENLCLGSQRILWGFFKKLVISDRLGVVVESVWSQDFLKGPWVWAAVLLFPLQIYTDFSGMLDIVLGSAEIFDIRLPENFRNPFLARTVQEFWQRWHMTLGSWAKDYVYYPVLKSRWLIRLGKWAKKRFSKRTAKLIPWMVGMAILWFVMGFWHGAVQYIVGVSLWFFAVLVISEIAGPTFKQVNKALHIREESLYWHIFQSVRTYILYAIGNIWFSAADLKSAANRFVRFLMSFGQMTSDAFHGGSLHALNTSRFDLLLVLLGTLLLFGGDLLRERHGYARYWVREKPLALRWAIWVGLFLLVLIFGCYGVQADTSGFIYQVF